MVWDEFDKWWHKHDNKEFEHCIRQFTDDRLCEV